MPSSTQVRRVVLIGVVSAVLCPNWGSGERLEARTVVVPIAVAGTTEALAIPAAVTPLRESPLGSPLNQTSPIEKHHI